MNEKKDAKLLNALIENSRLSSRQLSKKTGLSPATVLKKLKSFEKNKIIRGYSANLDYFNAGFDLQAIIDVKVSKGKLFEVEKKIARHHSVSAVYDVTGHFDVIVIAKFKKRASLDKFLKKIQTYPFVERTETRVVLNILKEEQIKV